MFKTLFPQDISQNDILKSNQEIGKKNSEGWLHHLKKYLKNKNQIFDLNSISLEKENNVFQSLSSQIKPFISGPLVSILMPAYNSEKTISKSIESILNQSWINLELIIIDDNSTDGTLSIIKKYANFDKRIKYFVNKTNVGPYVSKNIAIKCISGEWVTGQDADDWSLPQRIEHHMYYHWSLNLKVSLSCMLRMNENGIFSFSQKSSFSRDGIMRKCLASAIYDTQFFKKKLGYWDSVRFSADSEILSRSSAILGKEVFTLDHVGMICLDCENSLTNHKIYGVDKLKGMSEIRKQYKDNWLKWHKDNHNSPENLYLEFNQNKRKFECHQKMKVTPKDINECISI